MEHKWFQEKTKFYFPGMVIGSFQDIFFSFSSAASHGLSFTFVALGMCHRSFGVRLESLGKHSQQLVCPGIVPIGAVCEMRRGSAVWSESKMMQLAQESRK